MSFAVFLEPEAVSDLTKMPAQVRLFVQGRLNELAQSPASLSRPAHFPYPPNAQSFRFDGVFGALRWFFYVQFKYGADEQSLHVLFIAAQQLPLAHDGDNDDADDRP